MAMIEMGSLKEVLGNVFPRARPRELGLFSRQLALTLASGVSVIDALELSGSENKNRAFGNEIIEVKNLVKRGNSLSASMEKYPKSFPEFMIQMVRSGEISGCMDRVLDSVGEYYENQAELKSKIINALFYPLLVMAVAFGVVIYLITGVLPVFAKIYESIEAEMPLATKVLMAISEVLQYLWPLLFLIVTVSLLAFMAAGQTEKGKLFKSRFLLKLPFFGTFIVHTNAIRFAEALSVLVESGVDMLTGLETISAIMDNEVIKEKLQDVKLSVKRGGGLSESLAKAEVFDQRFYQMIRVGESSGTLDHVLKKIAFYYNDEVVRRLKRLTMLLEPAVLLFVGGLVFFIVAAVMEPVFGIYAGYSELF
ncbi:MAG: type II secretion system F family protein [Eubacterium sp.]